MTTIDITFGALVRKARMSQNLTQKQLAKILGKKYSWISQIENQRSKPDLYTVETFAKALGVETAEIMPDELGDYSMKSKGPSANNNVKLLLQCCFLAIGIVALVWLSVNNIAWVRTAVNKPSAEFTAIHALYPRHWEPLASWDCYRKLRQSDKALLPDAIQNYKRRVLAQRKKWGSYVPAFKNDKTFFCGNVWRNFVQGEME